MIAYALSGFLFWPLLYIFNFYLIQALTSKCFLTTCHVTSIFQGLLTCSVGIYILKKISGLDLIEPSPLGWLVEAYALFQGTYFAWDLLFMKWKRPETKLMSVVKSLIGVHHILIVLVFIPIVLFVRKGKGDFFVACYMLFEASAPFTNLRAILHHHDLKQTRIYKLNGIAMLISFFFARIYMVYYMYSSYALSKSIPTGALGAVPRLPIHCNVGTGLLLALQVYWFSLMLKGAAKLFLGKHQIKKLE